MESQRVREIVEREPIRPPKGSAMIQTPQIGDSIDQNFAPYTSSALDDVEIGLVVCKVLRYFAGPRLVEF